MALGKFRMTLWRDFFGFGFALLSSVTGLKKSGFDKRHALSILGADIFVTRSSVNDVLMLMCKYCKQR